jgi:hypothetical protein
VNFGAGSYWDTSTEEFKRVKADVLGKYPWLRDLSTRCANAVVIELRGGGVPDLAMTTVRAHGRERWLRVPNMGRMTANELDRAVGGFEPPPPTTPPEQRLRLAQQMAEVREMLAKVLAALDRLEEQHGA